MRVALVGPRTGLGLLIAVLVFALDRANKVWFLDGLGLAGHRPIEVAPFLELVLVWNRGVSYGLFPQYDDTGRYVLIAFSVIVSCGLLVWLARVVHVAPAAGIGLVVGGALGNVADRLVYGAVADFYRLHGAGFSWYVFNLADTAIVGGVAILLYQSAFGGHNDAGKPR